MRLERLEHKVKHPVGDQQARPLLLVHGAWHAAWCYDLWSDAFASFGYETHTFSMPAHGESPSNRPINLLGLGNYVDVLSQVIESIQPTPYVIAHSLGGFVLQHYIQRAQSHEIPAAVLLCTLPYFGAVPFYLRYFRRHPLRYLGAIITMNLRLMVNQPALAREYFISEEAAVSPKALAALFDQESLRVAIECMFPIRHIRHKIPLLVIAAERDGIFTLDEQKRVAAKYGSELIQIPDQGHNLMVERDWQQVAHTIHNWIERQQTNSS